MATLSVSVPTFEDVKTSGGEVVTMYIINVQYSERSSFFIAKRYSDFSDLYNQVKGLISQHTWYKFPNKSMFNTSAEFTKKRRLKGFDELMKILAACDPLPKELNKFLELSYRISHAAASSSSSTKLSNSSPVADINTNIATDTTRDVSLATASSSVRTLSSEARAQHSAAKEAVERPSISSSTRIIVPEDLSGGTSITSNSNHQGRTANTSNALYVPRTTTLNPRVGSKRVGHINSNNLDILPVNPIPSVSVMLPGSFKISSAAYTLCMILGLIDISSSSVQEVLLTYISLGLLCTYVRLIRLRMNSQINEHVESPRHEDGKKNR